MQTRAFPVVLCILDGWGITTQPQKSAPALADTPTFDHLMASCPNATLITHGPDVGLPEGQMGNSEVGHTNIGAGRIVPMDIGSIDLAIEDGSFARHPAILDFVARLKKSGGTAHLMGVASDGGVHGHISHIIAACHAIAAHGIPIALHALTDGRDVAPASAASYIATLEAALPPNATIASVIGRYWAMDRDHRWERVQLAHEAMVHGNGPRFSSAQYAIKTSYANNIYDEFIPPSVVGDYAGTQAGDGFFCLNFRADRAREIMAALGEPDFAHFKRKSPPEWAALLGMVDYSAKHTGYMQIVFPKPVIHNTLGEWVSKHDKRQFRVAETEKYPHVTFFLNGGREALFPGEERAMPPSPKVATYDLCPEMSAAQVTKSLVGAIDAGFDLIIVNYANPDMVGHTGVLEAAAQACHAVDQGLKAALEALAHHGTGAMIVTADHGNCEQMWDYENNGPHTAHTLNPVPVILYGGPKVMALRDGILADLAPTLLDLMGIAPPPEMTGKSLLVRQEHTKPAPQTPNSRPLAPSHQAL